MEYVNKSARKMGNLRRELTTMMQEHPKQDTTRILDCQETQQCNVKAAVL